MFWEACMLNALIWRYYLISQLNTTEIYIHNFHLIKIK